MAPTFCIFDVSLELKHNYVKSHCIIGNLSKHFYTKTSIYCSASVWLNNIKKSHDSSVCFLIVFIYSCTNKQHYSME